MSIKMHNLTLFLVIAILITSYSFSPGSSRFLHKPTSLKMSVQSAWDNHFEAFGGQDLAKILLDYTEDSQVIVWDTAKGSRSDFKGISGVTDLFTNLFKDLSDLSTLAAPLIEVQEDAGQVMLVWECPGCGFKKVTDTFIFKGDKILRQNIVVFN